MVVVCTDLEPPTLTTHSVTTSSSPSHSSCCHLLAQTPENQAPCDHLQLHSAAFEALKLHTPEEPLSLESTTLCPNPRLFLPLYPLLYAYICCFPHHEFNVANFMVIEPPNIPLAEGNADQLQKIATSDCATPTAAAPPLFS